MQPRASSAGAEERGDQRRALAPNNAAPENICLGRAPKRNHLVSNCFATPSDGCTCTGKLHEEE